MFARLSQRLQTILAEFSQRMRSSRSLFGHAIAGFGLGAIGIAAILAAIEQSGPGAHVNAWDWLGGVILIGMVGAAGNAARKSSELEVNESATSRPLSPSALWSIAVLFLVPALLLLIPIAGIAGETIEVNPDESRPPNIRTPDRSSESAIPPEAGGPSEPTSAESTATASTEAGDLASEVGPLREAVRKEEMDIGQGDSADFFDEELLVGIGSIYGNYMDCCNAGGR